MCGITDASFDTTLCLIDFCRILMSSGKFEINLSKQSAYTAIGLCKQNVVATTEFYNVKMFAQSDFSSQFFSQDKL